ncbi:two-component system response regulator [Vibrio sp. JC009]|uniref:HD-GYP domain-containing protein n=1 Tax=Vibrio sp. JC009 TaxID=2912314 RepID=UPI0023B008FA|nr:two-component system response regulator [Vibrio sp. JC009]WED22898.1 two-component system response regulator [Vibrio sp. JC009]
MTDKETILVVDDTPENIDVLVGILKADYKIKVARNGETALKLAAKQPQPDLILLDIMMPGIDGYQVCEKLKSELNTRHIPVIFVTAKISPEDELKGLELGAVDYIAKPISPPIVKQRVRTHLSLFDQNRALSHKVKEQLGEIEYTRMKVIKSLGRAGEYKDNETGFHVSRMSHYTQILGIGMGMSEENAELLRDAATMHDIGKIGIPDSILKKPGKLEPEEFEIMKTHSEIGPAILGDTEGSELLEMASTIAVTHHEKWNGKGYPKGLKGEEIPLVGRIVAIADVFDALTSERPYKKAWSVEDTVALIEREAGEHFDPELVKVFKDNLSKIIDIKETLTD